MSARTKSLALTALIVLAAPACGPWVSKVPVQGDARVVAQLAGEWQGTYSSRETGRSGSILFRLRAGADTAEGDVLINLKRTDEHVIHGADRPTPPAASSPLLTIRFVVVRGNEVSGALDPYQDPVCGCKLTTRFLGVVSGGLIEGTFISEGSEIHHLPAHGTWRVTRLKPRDP
jgi:hypothetical protein